MFQVGGFRLHRRLPTGNVLTPNVFHRLMFLLVLIEIIGRVCRLHLLSSSLTRERERDREKDLKNNSNDIDIFTLSEYQREIRVCRSGEELTFSDPIGPLIIQRSFQLSTREHN